MSYGDDFGRILHRLRRERDLTQEALGQACCCSRDMVKKLEAGQRRPSRQLAALLADVLTLQGAERAAFLSAARARHAPAGEVVRRQLPAASTPFVGRVEELRRLVALLAEPAVRLVTLVAPGGMGKTRLSLAALAQLQGSDTFPDGVAFATLAAAAAADHLDIALTDALNLPLSTAGAETRTPRRQLLDYLREKRLLLTLDNCEHMLDSVAALASAILAEAPGVSVLLTSRERLGLRAERPFPLDGLQTDADGIALFTQVASVARPGFTLEADTRSLATAICARLGGMPLAIELAAGWADTLSVAEIAAELAQGDELLTTQARDVPERHRSVRAVWDATWGRLGAEERTIYAQVAVFSGGASRLALQAVTGAHIPQLQSLVSKGLLRYDPASERYTVHELLRQYAEEQLAADDAARAGAGERHAAYYLQSLASRDAALRGSGQLQALDEIGKDSANILAAWQRAAAGGRADLLLAAGNALGLFCSWQGRYNEGLDAFTQAVADLAGQQDGQAPTAQAVAYAWRGAFLRQLGRRDAAWQALETAGTLLTQPATSRTGAAALDTFIALQRGGLAEQVDFADAHAAYTRSLELARACGDRWLEARALAGLGAAYHHLVNNFDAAARCWEASLAILEELGDQLGRLAILADLSMNRRYRGRLDEGLALALASYDLACRVGSPLQRADALSNLGFSYTWLARIDVALPLMEEAVAIATEIGSPGQRAHMIMRLGQTLNYAGRYAEAEAALDAAVALSRVTGDRIIEHFALLGRCATALATDDYPLARQRCAETISLMRARGEHHGLALVLNIAALAERKMGGGAQARRLLLDALREGMAYQLWQGLAGTIRCVALLLLDGGAAERAIELMAPTEQAHHPLDDKVFGEEVAPLLAAVPPALAAAAAARGRQRDVWEVGQELLGELEAAGWGGDESPPRELSKAGTSSSPLPHT